MSAFYAFLLLAASFGLVTSTVYSAMVLIAAKRFQKHRGTAKPIGDYTPPLSILKPLHGNEPNLEIHLESFFQQDYPSYEIVFCARQPDDAGLAVAQRLSSRYPAVPVQILACGEPPYPNAKVYSLERMYQAARHDLFVISDSDVRVQPDYLRSMATPFVDPKVGMSSCVYRGVAVDRGLWARLEAVGMSIEMTSGVLVAAMIERVRFALGPTMAVRRRCVDQIGGFSVLGPYCADDFVLGDRVAANGHTVLISHHVIDHIVLNSLFADSMRHQIRWMKSTRFSRPKGHLGTALTFSVPFGLLAMLASAGLGRPLWGALALSWSVLTRIILAFSVGKSVLSQKRVWTDVLLYPLRDLMGFLFWVASYENSQIMWRGELYELYGDGLMRPAGRGAVSNDPIPRANAG